MGLSGVRAAREVGSLKGAFIYRLSFVLGDLLLEGGGCAFPITVTVSSVQFSLVTVHSFPL